MSYAFDMYFKNVENKLNAFEFCDKITKMFIEKDIAKEWIERNKFGIPQIKFHGNVDRLQDNQDGKWVAERILEYTRDYWISNLFTFDFFYWEEYNLVGLMLNACPQQIANEFDEKISFQSSCSQDYDYEDWGNNIPCFIETIEKIKNLNLEELAYMVENTDSIFFKENEDDIENFYLNEVIENEDFYRKSLVYCNIVEKLDLMGCLYDNVDDNVFTFSFCSINSEEKKFKYARIALEITEELLKK